MIGSLDFKWLGLAWFGARGLGLGGGGWGGWGGWGGGGGGVGKRGVSSGLLLYRLYC